MNNVSDNESALRQVLADLLDQAESIEAIRFSRALPEAAALWGYALLRARALVRKVERQAH